MSNKLPKHFLDEILRRNLDRMNIDPDQTIPDELFDTYEEQDNTLSDTDTELGHTNSVIL